MTEKKLALVIQLSTAAKAYSQTNVVLSAHSYACRFASFAYFLPGPFASRLGPIPTLLSPLYGLPQEEHGHDALLITHHRNQFENVAFEQMLMVKSLVLHGEGTPLICTHNSVLFLRKYLRFCSSGSNPHLLKPKTSMRHSGMGPTKHERRSDVDKRTSPYNCRDRLQNDRPIHEKEAKIHPAVSRKPRRIRKHSQGIAVTPPIDNHEPPDAPTRPPEDDDIDLFNEISSETRAELLSVVNNSLPSPGKFILFNPTSRASLYRNLLYLIGVRKPSAPLPSLVDYHSRYPGWQSTRSYNVLIDLSLRHKQHGITAHLFRSLERNGVSMNTESHKLMVRCLVQQSMWEDAWNYVWSQIKRNSLPKDANGREAIPFSIWLELCRAPKKRRNPFRCGGSSITLEEKYQYLHNITPAKVPSLETTSPFAIFCHVDLMLRTDRQKPAISLTKAYFKTLPQFLNQKAVLGCLRIIHCHMAHRTTKPGLPRFFDVRRTLISFLQLNPSLRPNGRTLCLLFKSLQRAKKCGTVAWVQLAKFKKDWGPQVENRRVLRRVAQLALKEGRLDITKKIHIHDFGSRVRRRTRLREESVVGRLEAPSQGRRLPYRLIYPRNGREARLWYRHRVRTRLKLGRLSLKGLVRPSQGRRACDTGP